MARRFRDLSEREILALAISLEEEDARIHADFADVLRETFPDTAKLFDEMRAEETEHRNSLMETYQERFGTPMLRGSVTGLMTATGGIGHTLPFLISDFRIALALAMVVVAVELAVISYIRHRYMETPILSAAFQVVLGCVLVFVTGMAIGSS